MLETVQRTDEWFRVRLGKVTASRIADATARTKTGWGASRANYMAELLCERLTGEPRESFTNAAMQWGTDMEPEARRLYEFMTGQDVVEVGFVDHPRIAMSGASPDGLVGELGLVEIKCPNTATHIETLLGAEIDGKYLKQMQWQMACTKRGWCDFVSYDPRLPESMQIHIQRVTADHAFISKLEIDVSDFLIELEDKEAALRAKYGDAA
ncbi:lambda exonuclease family protein [Gellertiella hungarica]|uniref:Putative phage-type endonuclease n=1 Tax=Gellertiella hungarica TaxID=1572859 RepID=A0A7W6NJR1_9HYPH|nr:lambda exonuclease family protein [Gellertiella hungarica]MBB4063640.1 putative phage-type endonuclease [Gellertiella hungarica]